MSALRPNFGHQAQALCCPKAVIGVAATASSFGAALTDYDAATGVESGQSTSA